MENGDRVKFVATQGIGHEGEIPAGAMGTYRGQSGCNEDYSLYEMDESYGFLETAYDVPNCLLL